MIFPYFNDTFGEIPGRIVPVRYLSFGIILRLIPNPTGEFRKAMDGVFFTFGKAQFKTSQHVHDYCI